MSFFRTCIYICLGLIVFNFSVIFIDSLGAFETEDIRVVESDVDSSGVLGNFTDLQEHVEDGETLNMDWFWGVLLAGGGAGFLISFLTKQIAPAGAIIFGTVFWASFIKTWTIIDVGGVISANLPGLLVIFFVSCLFLFIAAVIGMFTGSG